MSGKKNKKEQGSNRERISLNSTDHLHGHVDFFGIESRRTNKVIYQKLKVIQTWIFIQGLVLTLLVAYLILLTVWLAPLFPMLIHKNQDTILNNSPAFSAARSDAMKAREDLVDLTDDVRSLEDWRADAENDSAVIHEELRKHHDFIQDIYNITRHLDNRVGILEGILDALGSAEKIRKYLKDMKRCCDNNGKRLDDLECFKDAMGPTVDQLKEYTEGNLNALATRVNQITGTVETLINDTEECQQTCENVADEFGRKLNQTSRTLEAETSLVYQRFCSFKEFVADWEQGASERIETLENNVTCLNEKINDVSARQSSNVVWAKQKFVEERTFASKAVKVLSEALTSKVANLQCALDEVNKTIHERLNESLDMMQDELGELETELKHVNDSLTQDIESVRSELGGEITTALEQISQLAASFNGMNDTISGIATFIVIQELKEPLREHAEFTAALQNLKTDLCDFRESVETTNKTYDAQFLDLKERTCELERRQTDSDARDTIMEQRMTNAETGQGDLESSLQQSVTDFKTTILAACESTDQKLTDLTNEIDEVALNVTNCCAGVSGSSGDDKTPEYYDYSDSE